MSLKEYIYIAVILGLVVAFGYTYEKGKHNEAQAAKIAALSQEAKDAKTITDASKIASDAVAALKVAQAAPPPSSAPIVRVCNPSPKNVPAVHSSGPTNNGPTDEPTVVRGPDVGPVLDQRFSQDDAHIRALQAYIEACQKAGRCAK